MYKKNKHKPKKIETKKELKVAKQKTKEEVEKLKANIINTKTQLVEMRKKTKKAIKLIKLQDKKMLKGEELLLDIVEENGEEKNKIEYEEQLIYKKIEALKRKKIINVSAIKITKK